MSKVLAPFELLELNVISAQDLAPVVSRSMKTYAVAWVNSDRKLSTGIDSYGNTNPTWNDKFVFRVDEEFLHKDASAIMIEIYALHNWFKDALVGTVRVLVSNLISPPSKSHHNTRPPPEMRSIALQVRRPSSRPQGILNIGVTVLDSSMRSMPLYTDADASAVGYRHLMGEEDVYAQRQTPKQPALRRTRSDCSSMVNSELKVEKKTGSLVSASGLSLQQQKPYSDPDVDYIRKVIKDGNGEESSVINDSDEVAGLPTKTKTGSKKLNLAASRNGSPRGTPMHPTASSTPDRKMSKTPRHPMMGTPQHAMSATPRHRLAGTPQHPMSGTPGQRKAATPQHPNMYGTPRHAMTSGSLRHGTDRTPMHAMSGTPVHRKSGGTTMTRKPKTPLHGMSFTRYPEYETPRKSALMGGGAFMINSELGPSPSEVAAAVAKVLKDNESSIVGEWNLEENGGSVEGLESKLERWKAELPPVYDDNGDFPSSPSSKPSRHARRHTDGGSASGLFSCFSTICGVQCSIVCGGSEATKAKKGNQRRSSSSSEVASYL